MVYRLTLLVRLLDSPMMEHVMGFWKQSGYATANRWNVFVLVGPSGEDTICVCLELHGSNQSQSLEIFIAHVYECVYVFQSSCIMCNKMMTEQRR